MNNVLLISARITSSVMDGKNLDKLFIENFKDPQSNLTENKKSQIKAITFDTLRYFKTLSFFLDSLIKKEIQNKLKEYVYSNIDVKKKIEHLYSLDMMIWNSF